MMRPRRVRERRTEIVARVFVVAAIQARSWIFLPTEQQWCCDSEGFGYRTAHQHWLTIFSEEIRA
jgi:hypothetical protein